MRFKNFVVFLIIMFISMTFGMFLMIVKALNNNNYLFDKIIYIDAGHGGKDNGAVVNGVLEDSINLAIANYLVESLIDAGSYVLVSRTNDYDLASLYQKNRKREDLNKRVHYINKIKPDVFVSIHLNTYSSNEVNGAQVFHQNNEDSRLLSEMIQQEFNVFSNNKKRVKQGDYFILNKTLPVGVLVECGFLSNDNERKKLVQKDYQRMIANVLKRGIIKYIECKESQ